MYTRDVWVPSRGQGRPKDRTEIWAAYRLLATFATTGLLQFPLRVERCDRPGFVISPSNSEIGIELAEAISTDQARVDAQIERDASSGFQCCNFQGNVPTDVETRAEVGVASLERQARGVNSGKGSNTMKTSPPTTTRHAGTIAPGARPRGPGRMSAPALTAYASWPIDAMTRIFNEDTADLAGERCGRDAGKPGYRWGTTTGMAGFRGGKIRIERPRLRDRETGRELPLPSREEIGGGGLEQWATSLMLVNGQARRLRRATSRGRNPRRSWLRPVTIGGLAPPRSTGRGEVGRMDVVGHPGA